MRTPIALALALVATPALAGNKATAPVQYSLHSDGSFSFSGSVGDARASADGNQFIGCSFTGSTIASGYCYAVDALGRGNYCLLGTDPQLRAVATIGPMSWISVDSDARNGCINVRVDNFSYYRPVTP